MEEDGTVVQANLIENILGNTLFHCLRQDYIDPDFMPLFPFA
jgi:hypothetical protein